MIGNALPKPFSKMVNLALNGKIEEARVIHYQLLDLMNTIFEDGSPGGIKVILEKFQDLTDKLIKKNKESKLLKSIQKDHKHKQKLLQKSLLKSEKKKRKENKKKLYEILNDKKTIQEDEYFSKELTIEEQTSVIEKITEIKNYFNIEKPYLITLT